jgi:molybdate transport system substrate-binding protein
MRAAFALFVSAVCATFVACEDSSGPRLDVAAAADLRDAFAQLEPLFKRQCGCDVRLTFGSSGTFATQIREGLPVDVLFSANEAYIDGLARDGLVLPETVHLYAVGRIVLATPEGSGRTLTSLHDLLDPSIAKVALPNPDHAPYGVAGKEALEAEGLWEAVRPKIVFAENAAQATDFVESGNARAGIVPLSLVVQRQDRLRYTLIDDALHEPLRQAAAVVARSRRPDLAAEFIEFVNGPEGRPVMRTYGFTLPGEEPAP